MAVRNWGTRKYPRSSSGCTARRSCRPNHTPATALTHSSAITSGAANPAVSALITAKTSADNATAPSTVPAMSTRCAPGSALSGRTSVPRPSAAAPKARLNQKIARQSQIPVSTPPMAGPWASASPQTAVQTPTARSRSRSSGYRWRSVDSVPGSLAAAPRPITAQPAIRTGALGAIAHSTEPTQKTAAPDSMVRDQTAAARRLVGVGVGDLDDCTETLAFAFEEAALRKASLIAIHAWHAPQAGTFWAGSQYPPPGLHIAAAAAARQLTLLMDTWHQKHPDVPVRHDVVHGHPGRALAGLSARADLVVIGRHATHPGPQGPGSARHAVLNHAHGPVAIVPSS